MTKLQRGDNKFHAVLITEVKYSPICIYGTYFNAWDAIKAKKMGRMSRKHLRNAQRDSAFKFSKKYSIYS
jgi:hypothetical protein